MVKYFLGFLLNFPFCMSITAPAIASGFLGGIKMYWPETTSGSDVVSEVITGMSRAHASAAV
jgi:hypothetical protein